MPSSPASYAQRLLAALDDQENALGSLGFQAQTAPANGAASDPLLAPQIDRNESLCRELISGNAGANTPRSAQEIIPRPG